MWNKFRRIDRSELHLLQYRRRLFDQLIEETDPEKEKSIQCKLDKIANKIVLVKKRIDIMLFELNLSDLETDLHYAKFNKYLNDSYLLHHIIKKDCKVTHISKTKIQQLEKEDCCICLSNHKIKDIVSGSCGHTYGKCCFEQIIKTKFDAREDELKCPLCRSEVTKLTIYRKK